MFRNIKSGVHFWRIFFYYYFLGLILFLSYTWIILFLFLFLNIRYLFRSSNSYDMQFKTKNVQTMRKRLNEQITQVFIVDYVLIFMHYWNTLQFFLLHGHVRVFINKMFLFLKLMMDGTWSWKNILFLSSLCPEAYLKVNKIILLRNCFLLLFKANIWLGVNILYILQSSVEHL